MLKINIETYNSKGHFKITHLTVITYDYINYYFNSRDQTGRKTPST